MSTDEAALERFHNDMVTMGETLTAWLDSHFTHDGVTIFFLAGMLSAVVERDWPDPALRPTVLNELIEVLNQVGRELGPMVALMQLDKISKQKRRKRTKETIN